MTRRISSSSLLPGAFIAIVMTGLDQDLMQKNLTCKNIGEAQKNMFWFTVTLVFVNFLFLSLGVLLYVFAQREGIAIPARTDDLYPLLALNHLGLMVGITFLLGITAATYASSDSALTALTTSFCIDFMNVEKRPEAERSRIKQIVHLGFSVVFFVVIIIFRQLNSKEVITAVFDIAGYTYGPLLGLYAFGISNKRPVTDWVVPFICLASPALTYLSMKTQRPGLAGISSVLSGCCSMGCLPMSGLWAVSKPAKEGELSGV